MKQSEADEAVCELRQAVLAGRRAVIAHKQRILHLRDRVNGNLSAAAVLADGMSERDEQTIDKARIACAILRKKISCQKHF